MTREELIFVTPLAGVWIEIQTGLRCMTDLWETPLEVVWIEIILLVVLAVKLYSHSPCGSVD